jgi:hypothetical protein
MPVRHRVSQRLGFDAGRFTIPNDFDSPLPDEVLDAFG